MDFIEVGGLLEVGLAKCRRLRKGGVIQIKCAIRFDRGEVCCLLTCIVCVEYGAFKGCGPCETGIGERGSPVESRVRESCCLLKLSARKISSLVKLRLCKVRFTEAHAREVG